jgi:YD repeat-containing protein
MSRRNLVSETLPERMRLWCYRNQHPNAIVALVSEVDAAGSIYRYTRWEADFRSNR